MLLHISSGTKMCKNVWYQFTDPMMMKCTKCFLTDLFHDLWGLKTKQRGCMFTLFALVLHSERCCYCKWIMFSRVIFYLILFHSDQEVTIFRPHYCFIMRIYQKASAPCLHNLNTLCQGFFFMAGCKFPTALSDFLCLCVGVFTGEVFSYSPVHINCPEAVVYILQITLLKQINQL